ncbi:carbohydrate-binding protein [Paenibacillus sp. TRM 82003]|nr:carbohydrate-binding protein [Paenibacillus sp. TRM 82003]
MISNVTFENIKALGNPETLGSLGEMNIMNTGFYQNVTIVPNRSQETTYRIQAESNNGLHGVDWNGNKIIKHVASTDTGNVGYMIGQIAHANYAMYRGGDFGVSTSSIGIRYDAPRAARVELHLDSPTGPMIGAVDLAGNGGSWSQWNQYSIPVSGASGVRDLVVVFKASGTTQTNQLLGNLNWFELSKTP